MLVLDIIKEAREILGDKGGNGWTANRLKNIISSGQRDICKQANLLKKEIVVPLINLQSQYSLPLDLIKITRIEYNASIVNVLSREQLDETPINGYTCITDNLPMGIIEVTPVPKDIDTTYILYTDDLATFDQLDVTSVFGVVSDIESGYSLDTDEGAVVGIGTVTGMVDPAVFGEVSFYADFSGTIDLGVVVGIDEVPLDERDEVFGIVTGSTEFQLEGYYGCVVSAMDADDFIRVYYTAAPERLVTLGDPLQIPDLWFDALVFYTVSMALAADNDMGNKQRSVTYAEYYDRELGIASDLVSTNFQNVVSSKLTSYRGGIKQ
jgi:hypothetical protein